jgi:hypothetical protein
MWYPMAFEPLSKSQKKLNFHFFWDVTKNGGYKCIFHFSFLSKSTLIASISCICKYKLLCNHFCNTSHFYQMPQKIDVFKVANMVDFDKNCKRMGWNGHDSL